MGRRRKYPNTSWIPVFEEGKWEKSDLIRFYKEMGIRYVEKDGRILSVMELEKGGSNDEAGT